MNLRSFETPRSRKSNSRRAAFTIIESLILLVILLVMTMIVIALARRHFLEPVPVEPNPAVESQAADPAATAKQATSGATE